MSKHNSLFEIDSDKLLTEILIGVNKGAKLIAKTMGPNGKLVSLNGKFTKDGATVASNMHPLSIPSQEIGRKALVDLSKEIGQYGDGSTTAAVFFAQLINVSYKILQSGVSLYDLKKGLNLFEYLSCLIIESIKIPVSCDNPLLEKIIAVSVNHDYALAKLIVQPYQLLGKHAKIVIEESKKTEDYLEIKPGCSISNGVLSSAFFMTPQEQQKNIIEMENACVLVTDSKLVYSENLMKLLTEIKEKGQSLLIIAGDIDDLLLRIILANRVVFNAVVIKAPGFGDRKIDNLRDVSILTGAEVLLTAVVSDFTKIEYSQLGFAKKVVVKTKETIIIEGAGDKNLLNQRIAEIKDKIANATTEWEKDKSEERLSALGGGIATLSIGGFNQSSINEKKDRCTDGCQTATQVVTTGAIPGAGSESLYVKHRITKILNEITIHDIKKIFTENENNLINKNNEQQNKYHIEILEDLKNPLIRNIILRATESLDCIFDTITENADTKDSQVIKHNIYTEFQKGNIYTGYNILDKEIINLVNSGILAPLYGFKSITKKATELAIVLISTGGAIYDKPMETQSHTNLY